MGFMVVNRQSRMRWTRILAQISALLQTQNKRVDVAKGNFGAARHFSTPVSQHLCRLNAMWLGEHVAYCLS